MNTRRQILKAGAAAFTIVPRHVLGGSGYVAPSDKITLGCVGVGSQGQRVMMEFLEQPDVKVVAVCDCNKGSSDFMEWGDGELRNKARKLLKKPDWGSSESGASCGVAPSKAIVDAYYGNSDCGGFADYRELLEKVKGLDSVIIGTPDHWHAPVAVDSMRAGKHVMCQKPMAHSIEAARQMAAVARETKRATQVTIGNQASEDTRLLCEWIWAGAIGPVREAINWSSRPLWPQGIERPAVADPVPDYLDWKLWLGAAPERPFSRVYQPFVWRGWYDFGCGAIGDMGCYSFDTLFRVLKLTTPATVEASSSEMMKETFPKASIIRFGFPARGDMPPVKITWYDGGLKPARPEELTEGQKLDKEGMLYIGDKGSILCEFTGANPRLIPQSKMDAFEKPAKILPRSAGNDREWIEACKGGPAGGANFEFSARVTETILLGNAALRKGELPRNGS